ncbi:S1/P1 nuclease [uncultured Bradyrhizobium sp.]|uniref:S1/P1 nuclease n=1 Tax=uncultured Bradyrhizobium sp. TaxID=199684 RepID=UPI0035CC5060
MKALLAACVFLPVSGTAVFGWGQEGHAIVAEIAQRRLSDDTRAAVSAILKNVSPTLQYASLASFASWADDYRPLHQETTNWHFVDIPLKEDVYDPTQECKSTDPKGDCVIAELERLKNDIWCKTGEDQFNALKFAVHFVGDIQQPLHTVLEEFGGNNIFVEVQMKGLVCTGSCVPTTDFAKFHAVWDTTLIQKTVFAWGSYVDRLEAGWLVSADAAGAEGGTPTTWALEAHKAAQAMWAAKPANNILNDSYYQAALPVLDRQLAVGGLRLAKFLNDTFAAKSCTTVK